MIACPSDKSMCIGVSNWNVCSAKKIPDRVGQGFFIYQLDYFFLK